MSIHDRPLSHDFVGGSLSCEEVIQILAEALRYVRDVANTAGSVNQSASLNRCLTIAARALAATDL